MSNLETLDLSLQIELKTPFIDGHHLKLNIISHMSLLNKFTFNIYSDTEFYNQTNTPSNECIQQTFQDFPNKQIISCVDYFPEIRRSRCHFYSYPYSSKLRIYKNISNNFPDGIFRKVRRVSLYDERPFEHEFFFRISQSFPSMENLSIFNRKPQKQKQFRRSPNQNQHLSIIKYDQLVELELRCAHKDYYRQFLFDDRSCLPEKISVYMDYRLAKKVTHNFTSKAARNNCAKIIFTAFVTNSKFPDRIKDYLPRARDLDLDL
jgi:hypothetical protein